MKLLKTGRVAGCDWTANVSRSRHNGRRGLRYPDADTGKAPGPRYRTCVLDACTNKREKGRGSGKRRLDPRYPATGLVLLSHE